MVLDRCTCCDSMGERGASSAMVAMKALVMATNEKWKLCNVL